MILIVLNLFPSLFLLQEITRFNCQELVRSVPFLAGASETFISSIITKLNFEVYLPQDCIINYGTLGQQMYFIQGGVVDVVTKDGFVVTTLSEGSYFGGTYSTYIHNMYMYMHTFFHSVLYICSWGSTTRIYCIHTSTYVVLTDLHN